MEHQDLKTVYLRKSKKEFDKDQRRLGATETIAKKSNTHYNKKILDDDPDEFKVNKVSHSLRTQIQQSRMALNMTQKELAQKINVTASVIQSYENGKAIPDNQVLQKLRRVLKVKLVK